VCLYVRSVAVRKQEGNLARTHEGKRGLPRGRHGLPAETVRAAQRERLLRSAIAAVAKHGFHDATVADIVRGAKVSKGAFYAHFTDKEDCFLAATRVGGQALVDGVVAATRGVQPGTSAEEILRTGIAAFLGFLAAEPAFTRAFYIDMPTAGHRAADRLEAAQHTYARLNQVWQAHARRDHPDWPAVPYEACLAVAAATAELVRAAVRHGNGSANGITGLQDTLVALHLAVLAGRPWTLNQPEPA
jgi:AcrR family transcriptional regulator